VDGQVVDLPPVAPTQIPGHLAAAILARKWAPVVIGLLRPGPRSFSELLVNLPNVAHKVLIQQLRALERDGVVARAIVANGARRTLYSLTASGAALVPVLDLMDRWAREHHGPSTRG
jgi:DNA-binding HxlR family transcriptional regulator